MQRASTSTMWLLAAMLFALAAILQIGAADQVTIGIALLAIAAMFFVFSMTIGRDHGSDD